MTGPYTADGNKKFWVGQFNCPLNWLTEIRKYISKCYFKAFTKYFSTLYLNFTNFSHDPKYIYLYEELGLI